MNNDTDSDEPQCPFRERGIGERRFMLQEIIEPAWLDAFEAVLGRCALQKGDTVAILAETQSRPVLPLLARLAAQRLGAQVFTLTLPSVVGRAGPPARSTGASDAIQQIKPVVSRAGRQHAGGGLHRGRPDACARAARHPENGRPARVIYISNEHPEALVRLMPDDATEARVKDHIKRLRAAKAMTGHLAGGHQSAHFARRRGGRRQLGLHHTTRHPDPLARRHCAGLSGGGQRQRHAGAGRPAT
jgi:hypothetical protein